MAVQVGIGTFLGSDGGVTGYCDDSGRGLMRMKSSLDKAKWRRLPSMAGQREAARYFGAASKLAASVWRGVPVGMKRIMDAGAFNRLVGAFMGALGEDGNVVDGAGLVGVDLNLGSLSLLMRDEGGGMRVGLPAAIDDRGRMKEESLAAGVGAAIGEGRTVAFKINDERLKRKGESRGAGVRGAGGMARFVMAQRFVGAGVVHCAPTDANLGSLDAFRAGVAAIRARQALCGEPVRRRRTWVCVCEIGTVVVGGMGQFRLLQNGLGRGSFCTPWEVDGFDYQHSVGMRDEGGGMRVAGDFDESGKMKDEGLGAVVMRDESGWVSVLADPLSLVRTGFGESEGCGIFLVMVGTEWAEKRGRHWVRMPYACEVGVVGCVEQNLQNSQNPQNCLRRSEDSQTRWLSGSQNCLNQEQTRWLSGLQDYLTRWLSGSQDGVLDSGTSTSRPDSIPASGTGRMTSQDLQNGGLGLLDGDAGADLVGGGMVLEFKLSMAAVLRVWMGELASDGSGEVVCGAVVLGLGP